MDDRAPGAPPLPSVAPGTVLRFAPGDWKYGGGEPLRIMFVRYRADLAYYDDEVWIEGRRLSEGGDDLGRLQALVRIDAIAP